jgi:hypothetical protein
MTSAFAKELGLKVHYQAVIGEEAWDRSNDLYIGHRPREPVLEERVEPAAASSRRRRLDGHRHSCRRATRNCCARARSTKPRDRDVPEQPRESSR